jgi:hypothetical protein
VRVSLTAVRRLASCIALSWLLSGCAVWNALGDDDDDDFGGGGRADASPSGGDVDAAGNPSLFGDREVAGAILGASRLAAGDANDDGVRDLLVSGEGPRLFAIVDGERRELAPPPFAFTRMRVADLDGDGTDDLVGRNSSNYAVMAGIPAPKVVETGLPDFSSTYSDGLELGDLDQDGRLDIAIAHDDSILVYLQSEEGAPEFGVAPAIPFEFTPEELGIIDGDGDGDNDIIAWDGQSIPARLLMARQDMPGSFGAPEVLYSMEVTAVHPSLRVSDFDGDGWLDVVTLVETDFLLLSGSASGTFTPATFPLFETHYFFDPLGLADVDGDGLQELLLFSPPDAVVRRQSAPRQLDDQPYEVLNDVSDGSSFIDEMLLEDIDGDQRADLVILNDAPELGTDQHSVSIYRGLPAR